MTCWGSDSSGQSTLPEDLINPSAIAAGERHTLYDDRLRVIQRSVSNLQQPYRSVQLDLSPWKGLDIGLVFEAGLIGRIQSHPLDFKAFALVWRGPRLQGEPGGARP